MSIAERKSHKGDRKPWETDFGETVVRAEATAPREEDLDFCRDFFSDFAALAEQYVPGIVGEFAARFPRRRARWLREGVVIPMGGGAAQNQERTGGMTR